MTDQPEAAEPPEDRVSLLTAALLLLVVELERAGVTLSPNLHRICAEIARDVDAQ